MPPILIQGETGTGKGLVARAMHAAGARASGPFVDVNCAAIPETLLEAEMFGVERGAFTDARQSKPGLLQLAHRGTIFLDEIGLLPEALQAKLLKAIEEREVRRLGGTRSETVDVWVIAATNEDLASAVTDRRFRADLYHRLAVVTLSLPSLRDRGADVLLLAQHFLARACDDYGMPAKTLTRAARDTLSAYRWPGNIRELSNVMERVALLSDATEVTPQMLGLPAVPAPARAPAAPAEEPRSLEAAVDDVERQHLLTALEATDWNVTRAAVRLGVSRNTLRYRIEKHGIRPDAQPAKRRAAPPPAPDEERPPEPAVVAPAPPVPLPPAAGTRERRRLALLAAALTVPSGADAPFVSRRALEVVTDKARSFGGRVEELNRTGIVAVFGLEPVEDAPVRAANAALAIVNGIERERRAAGTPVSVAVAVHVDHFVVTSGNGGVIDVEARFHAWTFLESLLSSVEPDGIVVSAAAGVLLERRFDLSPAALGEPGARYRLAGRERAGLALHGRTVTFVGRQQELDLLHTRLESAARGQGQIVGVTGDAGIGKSRLLFEFRRPLAGRTVTYLEGRCVSYGTAIPYAPVLDIVRAACQSADTDPPETTAAKVTAALREAGMDAAAGAPHLLHLLGVREGADALAALDPEEAKTRVFDTLRQCLIRSSRRRPLVLLIEDLHWIDRASEEFFASFADLVGAAPILMVATHRPGYRPTWIDRSYATQMALQPLEPGASMAVVRSVLGAAAVDESVVEMILVRGEGNPFFLEELARTVGELGGAETALVVPATVHDVVLARIDRLPPMEKHVLHVAAVIGKDAPLPLLREVAGLPEETLRQSLARLRSAELLYEVSLEAEPQYTFKHALTHDVAYDNVGDRRRRELHEAIVNAIERLHADRLGEHIERLAEHAFRAERWEKAVVHLRAAGLKAGERSAHREAVACFERALLALRRLPESQATLQQAVDLRFDLRTSLAPLGEHRLIFEYLTEGEAHAKRLGDRRRLARVLAYLAESFRQTGRYAHALEAARQALSIAETLGDRPLRIAARIYLGQTCYELGEYRRAAEYLGANVAELGSTLDRLGLPYVPAVHSRAWLVICLAELGEFAEASTLGDEALAVADEVTHPYSITSACSALGRLYVRQGDPGRAVPLLERGFDLARRWNLRVWVPGLASVLGSAYVMLGRVEEALVLHEQAVAEHAVMRRTAGHSIRVVGQAEACLAAGRVEEGAAAAQQALDLARQHGERGNEAHALRVLGDAAMAQPQPRMEQAEACHRQAIALATELGMRPLVAQCRLARGRLLGKTRADAAAVEIAAALALFRDLGMPFWLARAEEARRSLG